MMLMQWDSLEIADLNVKGKKQVLKKVLITVTLTLGWLSFPL